MVAEEVVVVVNIEAEMENVAKQPKIPTRQTYGRTWHLLLRRLELVYTYWAL